MRSMILLLAMACVRIEPGDPLDPLDDPFVDTQPTDDTGEAPRVLRPLCVDNLTATLVYAPDLQAWSADLKQGTNKFFGTEISNFYESLGEGPDLGATADERISNRVERGWHRLRLGQVDAALSDLTAAVELAETSGSSLRGPARNLAAVVWMRKAELDNCVSSGTGDACLVPFSEEAEHRIDEGMNAAADLLTRFLEEDEPGRIVPRWLLNVTQMALGTYPDGVDPRWRVPPERLLSQAPFPEWTNITPLTFGPGQGLRRPTLAGGAAIDDFDGDGLLDVMNSSMHPDQGMGLFLNTGDGLCDASIASGAAAITGILSFVQADYDNDGDLDVFAPRASWMGDMGRIRPSLMRNDGTGRFTDVAVEAGLADVVGPTQTAAWADADGDGWLDLFVGRERTSEGTAPASMYVNRGNGRFVDVAAEFGLEFPGYVKGAAWGDADNDGDPDLYVSTLAGPNHLFMNQGVPPFVEVTRALGVADPRPGFATWFFDHDQDGDLDIFGAAYPPTYGSTGWLGEDYGRSAEPFVSGLLGDPVDQPSAVLYENTLTGFRNVTAEVGLDDLHATMGANTGDLNADGFPDVYLGTGAPEYDALEPNTAYVNMGGHTFLDVTTDAHVGHLQKGHGVAFGDLDEDGDEDLLAQVGGAYPGDAFPDALFMNPLAGVSAVVLRLEGVIANRSAIGARVAIVTPGRTFHHLVGPAGSFGANSLQVEAGLGVETTIERVEIQWPGSGYEVVEGVEPGHVVRIREGSGVVEAWPFRRLRLADIDDGHTDHDHDD